ncbi:carbohydrate porin [Pseudomonas haemolytica]|uniref:Porin n=1 Tax=Pseudomonas haemolytica TaxID=2600065 RepID=A0A5P1DBW1_9PSED|nr:carbohydrate porin [Pseudomonas haemolytica]MBJ2245313.1 carbohydrate porin [Pseudomonas haemolytica]MBJ2272675.1 carbohydrate porin [Pseudomonas haemolytica]MBK3446985.1 carbohydrate porin [Pseudomonas haemolytica]MBK3458481.1 carbohydrate porin [Pseudomonas haemolytica]MRJ37139.1 porin [Pseudomonas haemolytica]
MNTPLRLCICLLAVSLLPQAWAQTREGPLADLGEQLAGYGIQPHVQFWSLSMKNLDTGPRPHSFGNSGDLFIGADINLGPLAGLDSSAIHIEETLFILDQGTGQPTSRNWQGAAGSYFAGAPIHNDITSNQLSLLTVEHQWLDGRLDLHVGRTNARRYFYIYNCDTVVTCNDPIIDASTGVLPPPYGAWGGYLKYQVNPSLYVHAGVFESNPMDYLKKRNGLDFSTEDASGTSVLLGLGSKPGDDTTQYELNAYFNTARQVDPLTAASDHGTAGAFFKFRQTLWRANLQGLQVFGSLSAAADDKQPFSHFAEAGLTYLAPFDRPQDKLNVKTSYLRVNPHQLAFQQQLRTDNNGNPRLGERDVYALEANAHVALSRNLSIEPSVQYLINPDNFYNPGARELSGNGFVVGLQVMLDVGSLLGL